MGRAPRDRVRAEARRLLLAGVAGQVFPGGTAGVSWRDDTGAELRAFASAGLLEKGGAKVEDGTRYDLGRITQAVVATAALRLEEAKEIDLDAGVEAVLPDVRGGILGGASLRALLQHRAGVAETGGLYLDVPHEPGSAAARRWVTSEAARRSGERPPGSTERSDLGYLIAGEVLGRLAGAPLEEVVERAVLAPLGVQGGLLYLGALPTERRAALMREIAPTERCPWRGKLVRGEVHDENAAAVGGVSGHAGLFGTAEALTAFGRAVLDSLLGRGDFLAKARMQAALAEPPDGSPVRLGWESPRGTPPPCGRHMSARAFGQVSITGASLFCDPERDVVVVLLTNRICPSRANEKIDFFRPAFHDGLVALVG